MKQYRKIYININSRCNCKCINCILLEESRSQNTLLNLNDISGLIAYLREEQNTEYLNIIEISGGEPTLHDEIEEILKLLFIAKTKDKIIWKISLLTNAITCSNEKFCSTISEYIDDVVVTLYDTTPSNHDWFTGVAGSFEKKVKAIDNFLKQKIRVHIKLLVIKPSYQNLPDMARFICSQWGNMVHVAINGTHFTGDAETNNKDLAFKYSGAKSFIEEALDIFEAHGLIISLFFPLCLIDPIYWKHSPRGFKDVIDRSLSISPKYGLGKADRLLDEFINRSHICKNCKVIERCNWPWKKYFEIYGENEISSAKEKMHNNIQQ